MRSDKCRVKHNLNFSSGKNEKYIAHKNLTTRFFAKKNLILKHTKYIRGNNSIKILGNLKGIFNKKMSKL